MQHLFLNEGQSDQQLLSLKRHYTSTTGVITDTHTHTHTHTHKHTHTLNLTHQHFSGFGLHLFDPLQQGGQPVLVDLAVAVQEGEDPGPRGVGPPHPGPDQT